MARLRPWDEEAAAGDLFAHLNGGSWEPLDGVDAPDCTYDIRAMVPTGRTVALEITQDTTQAIRRQHAIQAELDWTSDLLDGWWEVAVVEPFNVRALHNAIFDLIIEFDAGGERSLVIGDSTLSSPLVDRLHLLGVRLLHRVGDSAPGYVNVSPASRAGSTGPSVLVEIAEDHVHRPDNAKKLEIATTDERHLWIWVTHDRGQQIAALVGDLKPTDAPGVPEFVDTVWIATADTSPTVWSWSRHGGWVKHGLAQPVNSPVRP
jgi:hypothetical protein